MPNTFNYIAFGRFHWSGVALNSVLIKIFNHQAHMGKEVEMSLATQIAKGAIIASIVLMTGCASINKAPATEDAKSKQFKPNSTVSQVYVYRNETLGAALSMPVTVDGKLAGNTGPNSFFKFDLPAGEHKFTSQGTASQLTLVTELGKLYYIWQEVKMGMLSGGSKLQVVPAEVGMKGVAGCTQIQSGL